MILTSYPAGKGDAFLLTWGDEGDQHHMLIDSGIPNTYRYIRPDLQQIKKLDAVILTHVDYDHLGGFFKLLNDEHLTIPKDYDIYMNTPSLALMPPEDGMVKLEHGIELEKQLADQGITCKGLYNGFAPDNFLDINGLQLKVLTPPRKVVDELLDQWTADKLHLNYQEESIDSDMVSKPAEELASYEDIIKSTEKIHKWENDLINSSSISFIANYSGCAILFLGDANPDLVAEELTRLGYNASENKLKVDLVKLSHHGCKHNSGKVLFSIIDCDSFLISTNGAGPYFHPDRETIVRLAEYARTGKEMPLNIYLNHDLDTSGLILDEEARDWNILISHQNTFDFYKCECFQKK